MSTALPSDDLDYLLSLEDSDLMAWLSTLPRHLQESILKQLADHTPGNKLPLTPTPRQAEFLACTAKEALYGGAAGSGKSEALLMWLAEGISEPEYSGIIFRRTFAQLTKSNDSLIAKAYRLYPSIGGKFNQTQRQWKFPSGAMIEMGALEHEQSVLNYQGNSYHRIAFDELTQFSESQYEYLVNSRMRKTKGFPISLGARGASNPGGPGHLWVKLRFVTDEAIAAINNLDLNELTPQGTVFYAYKGRAFVPARLVDNPFLDREEYAAMLAEFTDPVMRARMLNGDWSIRQDGVIPADKIRWYDLQGEMYQNESQGLRKDRREMMRAIFVDCAGSSEDVAKEQRGGTASYSVAQVWDYDAGTGNMFLRHQIRGRWTFPVLCDKIDEFICSHNPSYTGIEDEKTGRALLQHLKTRGRNVRALSPEGKDKLTRAAGLLNRITSGQVWLLRNAPWLADLQSEWYSWTGHPDEMADQIDPAAYAAREFANYNRPLNIRRTALGPAIRN